MKPIVLSFSVTAALLLGSALAGATPHAAYLDFDGDGRADPAVFEPAVGGWHIRQSGTGAVLSSNWGWDAVTPVPGDYDGDGKADRAVFLADTGNWYIVPSGGGPTRQQNWGFPGVLPAPADYDGDGKTDLAVFSPPSGNWYVVPSGGGPSRQQNWGWSDTVPVPGDYDGDGKADLAVYYPAGATWYIIPSGGGPNRQQNWGFAGVIPVPGDYDGDGKADLAVYHPASGNWYVAPSGGGPTRQQNWGFADAVPVPADYDGDGKIDLAVYHRAAGTFWIWQSNTGTGVSVVHGDRREMPVGLAYQTYRKKLAHVPSRVVVFGDSLASAANAGGTWVGQTISAAPEGINNRTWSYQILENEDAASPGRATEDLRTKSFDSLPGTRIDYLNFAIGGAVSAVALALQVSASSPAQQMFPTPPPGNTLALITVGGDDMISHQTTSPGWATSPASAATANLGVIVARIRQIFGAGTAIHVAGLYDPTDGLPALVPPRCTVSAANPYGPFVTGSSFSAAAALLDLDYQGVAGPLGVSYADILTPFHGHGLERLPGVGWFADCVHPNDAGNWAVRDAFWPAIDAEFSTL
jgi:hypothetical protein